MGKPIVVLGQHEIDKIKTMPRKELNAECLHLMREQMELTQELHELRERTATLERLYEAVKIFHTTPRTDVGRATVVTALRTTESTLDELEAMHGVIHEPRQETD